jgi:GNAT superfamily N-acetyltransferase
MGGMAREQVAIELAGGERLDDLRPLWESLSAHHVAVAPGLRSLGPLRKPADSWAVRRAHYVDLFAEPSTFVLIATAGEAAVGYALVQVRGPEESWETGPVAVLETLAVLPEHRSEGLGGALVDATMAELAARGIGHWEVSTIATNDGAARFYGRLDLQPFTKSYIGRVPSGVGDAA